MGAYAQYLSMPEDGMATTKPANMTYEEAAGCPYGALMALGVLRRIHLQPGQHVLVVGRAPWSSRSRRGQAPDAGHTNSATGGGSQPRLHFVIRGLREVFVP